MRKILLLVVIVVLMVSCSLKNKKSFNPQKEITIERLNFVEKAGDCDNNYNCFSVEFKYDIFSSENYDTDFINSFIRKKIYEKQIKDDAHAFRAFYDSLYAEFNSFMNDFPETSIGWEVRKSFLSQGYVKNFLTCVYDEFTFFGGAHGNTSVEFFNFDLNKKTILDYRNFFTTEEKNQLNKIGEKELRKKFHLNENDPLSKAGLWEDLDKKFELNGNFLITEDGLKFLFNQYEIAPYSMGQIEILLPKENLPETVRAKIWSE